MSIDSGMYALYGFESSRASIMSMHLDSEISESESFSPFLFVLKFEIVLKFLFPDSAGMPERQCTLTGTTESIRYNIIKRLNTMYMYQIKSFGY